MQENIVTKETLKHALQNAGGGGKIYRHDIYISTGVPSVKISSVSDSFNRSSIDYQLTDTVEEL